jgi:predicted Zn-dependent protease
MRQELATAQTAAIVAMLLGVGALAAGAKSGSADMANVGIAAMNAPQSYLLHTLLAYQRAQEEQADRAGVRFLTMTGQSAKGMYDTFKRFADEMMFTAAYIDPYVQNHPMPTERMAALAELVKTPYWDKKDPSELQFRHDMMRAKLYGFTERADVVSRHYPASDTSLPARYAHAIVSYRFGDVRSALTQIEGLIQAKPNYPYFYELEGQALLESGHAAEAIAPLRHAVELAPNPALIQILLAQAMIATNNPKMADEAVPLLRAALVKEPESSDAYEHLAMAYGHNKNYAEADLASAEAAFARGDNKTARELAARAKTRFADDIVAFNKGKSPLLFGQ